MSGLEPLAALGLTCNIFQVISFARETLTLLKGVYHNGTIDESLMDKSTVIQAVATDIQAVEIPRPLSKHEQKLLDVTEKCTKATSELQEKIALLEDVGHNAKGRVRATFRTVVTISRRKRWLKRVEKDLTDSEEMMQSTLLVWILKLVNAAKLNTESLEENLRDFKTKCENGCRLASELVPKEALLVRETIARESRTIEMAVRDHVTHVSAMAEQRSEQRVDQGRIEERRKKFLNSLKYVGMNERVNDIENAHGCTFQWLFADGDDWGEGNDEWQYQGERPAMVWDSFTNWLQSDHSFYWIMGKPGSGKSTLGKFILSEPRTKVALGKWRHDAILVSHWFWRPGTLLQRNIKGMLCAILYQVANSVPNASEYASANVDGFDQKDSDTDWSVSELRELCLGLIRHGDKPLCLLVDGLDESGPEDSQEQLLEILESFKSRNVKIIASSRAEPIFQRRFRHQPQLRIQDLTDGDLRSYSADKLHNEIQKDHSFASDLVRKAEGVFLWLVLAVQSLNRGFGKGDSVTDLRKRMETLPERLNELYKDMWERLNDDKNIYRTDAALYFRLAIAAADETLMCTGLGFSIMDMMLASSKTSHDASAEISSMTSAAQLLEQCESFRINVEVRCAGLLSAPRSSTELAREVSGDTEKELLGYAHKSSGFRFIHRSARDFLDTEDGRSILQYEGMSSEDLQLCVVSAGLRAAELLHPILKKVSKRHRREYWFVRREFHSFLFDLSTLVSEGTDSIVEALFSRCFELYSSSILLLKTDNTGVLPARTAAFLEVAARLSKLDRYSINLVEKRFQVVGRGLSSAILLAIASAAADRVLTANLPATRARWLLSLHASEADINLKSPLLAFRPPKIAGTSSAIYTPDGMGPLDHIKASPFTRLLSSGLVNLDWKPIRSNENLPEIAEFLQLACDFVSGGGDLRSTVFLACPDRWDTNIGWELTGRHAPCLLEMPGWGLFREYLYKDDDRVLCVLALEATVVIQRMLDSLRKVCADHDSSEENEYGCKNDAAGTSDLEAAVSFLAKKCQEYGRGANAHVVGLLQPGGNFADMPYRRVSHQDSDNLIKDIWEYVDVSRLGECWDNLVARFREVVARSPFSCIGFRDYLRDRGCFDEFSAHAVLMDYEEDLLWSMDGHYPPVAKQGMLIFYYLFIRKRHSQADITHLRLNMMRLCPGIAPLKELSFSSRPQTTQWRQGAADSVKA